MPTPPISISIDEGRKLSISSQNLSTAKKNLNPIDATLSHIEQLGYIQIDTISVIERAHHHTLWARHKAYHPQVLDQLIEQKQVFEYWSHAAAYLPMKDYRYTLPMKNAIQSGEQKHWFKRDLPLMKSILKRIKNEGPLMAKDFANTKGKLSGWEPKPSKQALENLFIEGELMISSRCNFHKVYDLTEHVLPLQVNTKVPTLEESIQFLIISYLRANGIGLASEMCYLRKGVKKKVVNMLDIMVESKEIIPVNLHGTIYYCLPQCLETISLYPTAHTLKILSPFDNLLIQRKRTKALFNYEYLLECYLPATKRQYGYFSLPILWANNLVARMDCKVDRKTSIMHINHLAIEPHFKVDDNFILALSQEIKTFMIFNSSNGYKIHKTTPTSTKSQLHKALKVLIQL